MLLDFKNVDWSLFQLAKSGRTVKLLYNKEPVQFCTSTLYSPFGVKSTIKDWASFTEYTVDASINQSTNDVSIAFREFLDNLDKKIEELIKENINIFGLKNAESEFTYFPVLRENKEYPKLMKLQFPRDKNGNFETFFFDENKNKLKMNESNIEQNIPKRKMFKCIIECSKVWFFNGKAGSIWNTIQLKMSENKITQKENEEELSDEKNNNKNVYNQMLLID